MTTLIVIRYHIYNGYFCFSLFFLATQVLKPLNETNKLTNIHTHSNANPIPAARAELHNAMRTMKIPNPIL